MPNCPAVQLVHTPAPTREYCPAGHVTCLALVDPAGHANPAAHDPLHVATVTPADAPYKPAGHCPVQLADVRPLVLPNSPSAHWVHVPDPARLNRPSGHMDEVPEVEPAGQAYPAGHVLHAAAVAALHCPAGHCVGPEAPWGQK